MSNTQPMFSKLHEDELLFIELFHGEPMVMTKGEFLQSDEWANYPYNIHNVSIANQETMHYNFRDYIETIGEDAYDDWDNQVWDDIKDTDEYKKFNELMLNVINSHKVYYPGQTIYIDYKKE